MPVFVSAGAITSNSPQQNSAVVIGQNSISGWDANMKFNTAMGGNFGVFSVNMPGFNVMVDNLEFIDGVIVDPDLKPSFTTNV